MTTVHDFAELDKLPFNYYALRLAQANKMGYKYFTEALHHLYYECGHCLPEVGHVFDMSAVGTALLFSRLGWPKRDRGGIARWGGLYPHLGEVIFDWLSLEDRDNKSVRWAFYQEKAKKYGVSTSCLRALCQRTIWEKEWEFHEQRFQKQNKNSIA